MPGFFVFWIFFHILAKNSAAMTQEDKTRLVQFANKGRKELFNMGDIHEGSPPGHLCAAFVMLSDGTCHKATYNLSYGFTISVTDNDGFSHYDHTDDVIAYIKN